MPAPDYIPPNYAPPPSGYAPTGYIPGYAPVGVAPVQSNSGWATASLVLGLLGLCLFFPGIGAVICGYAALNQINRSDHFVHGKGLATAGLVLGYLEIAALVIAAIAQLGHT